MSCNRVIDNCPGGNRRSYIATKSFSNYFYTYNEATGSLTDVTNDDALCPVGRVLRENGKKLYPGANAGINQYYVGVYDPVSLLKGFIDPNGGVFSEFNTNKPTYLDDNYSDDGESDDNSEGPDAGDAVYTKGNVTAVSWNNPDSSNNNYIQLVNDVDGGNAAYMAFDDVKEPYIECRTSNDSGAGSSSAGIYTYSNNAELYANAPNAGEAQLELDAAGFVGAYASDGSIYNSGVMHPYNTCDVATLNGTAGVQVTVPTVNQPVVILSRKTINGNVGVLTWSVVGTTLTIYSTESTDIGEVGWLLVSSDN